MKCLSTKLTAGPSAQMTDCPLPNGENMILITETGNEILTY